MDREHQRRDEGFLTVELATRRDQRLADLRIAHRADVHTDQLVDGVRKPSQHATTLYEHMFDRKPKTAMDSAFDDSTP